MTRTRVMTQYGWEPDMDFGMIGLLFIIVGVLWIVDQGDQVRKKLDERNEQRSNRDHKLHKTDIA